mgnify:CR=1 FL=1
MCTRVAVILIVVDLFHMRMGDKFCLFMTRYSCTLKQFLSKQTALLPPARVYWLGLQIVNGLSFLHANGIIHRDIKVRQERASYFLVSHVHEH